MYLFKDEFTFNVGIGFNLANSEPTLSFNDLLKKQGISPLEAESYFANFFNCLENFLEMLDTDQGIEDVLKLYHHYWLHTGQKVSVINANNDKVCGNVKCIDEFGFLVVKLQDGQEVSVQPGSNSFDMMQGLIMPKRST